MIGWLDKVLDIRAGTLAERERRTTYVEVLRNLPDRSTVDDQKADGSRLLIYIQPSPEPETT
ncbi:hypothetical protein FXN61_19745 [Lentzea sp. PSKA42]|uniref:Uncharacterized protein n=1 Tax=Lentzea indica TaxID=2604800 RepID=A0ABX1FIV8_9PSEU|nr:hypothetical protein [Lentzea indica]NKE58923.1 hypothetical protein [Lentzea indica]